MTDPRTALEEAFKMVFPEPYASAVFRCQRPMDDETHALDGLFPDWDKWNTARLRFRRFLDAEAWTDAALMLVPDDGLHLALVRHLWADEPDKRWGYAVLTKYKRDSDGGRYYDREFTADHEVPALAIAQAALRAKEAGDV